MRTVFISDLHLSEERPDITRALFRFIDAECINSPEKTDAFYILGDFFEAWIGDDAQSPLISDVKNSLKAISTAGINLYLMHGNRDFLIGNSFCDDIGATLITDGSVIELNGEPVLLMHGDILCTQDTDYLTFREMVRNPLWQRAFLEKSIVERIEIAQQLRQKSQESAGDKASYIMDVDDSEVTKQLNTRNIKTMIHGHTHRPAVHNLTDPEQGRRIVLGDWDKYGWMLIADSSGLTLNKFPIEESQ